MTTTTPEEQTTIRIINLKLDPQKTSEELKKLNKIFKGSVDFALNTNGDTISITSNNGYDRLIARETVYKHVFGS